MDHGAEHGRPGRMSGSDLVAEGGRSLHYSDKDASGVGEHNANQWGFTGAGLITTTTGDPSAYATCRTTSSCTLS